MSTNSNIIIKHPDLTEYASIYCHWDGYLSHNGKILLENYKTHDQVVELVSLGDLSELHNTADECVSYHRWRGDAKNIRTGTVLSTHADQEYAYLFQDGKWFWLEGSKWVELTKQACKE